jgi:O-methyltransferase domain/Dimerisation domain
MLPKDLDGRLGAFRESRVLLTAIELDLFNAVGEGAAAAEVARTLKTDARATEMLLNALASLGMLEKRGGVFRNAPEAARYFTSGSPADERLANVHKVHLWNTWSTLTECVRKGTAVRERPVGADQWTAAFIAAMHSNAAERVPAVVPAVDATTVRRMLDVGGGSGAYSIAFASANPGLHAEILDLPSVVPIAREHIAAAGLGDRVTAREGDLRSGGFGTGYDLVFVSAICHMLGPQENRELVARSFAALAAGGRLAIQEFILNADRAGPPQAALFALNMLVGTLSGNAYTEEEYSTWMQEAGFSGVHRVELAGPSGLMIGLRE